MRPAALAGNAAPGPEASIDFHELPVIPSSPHSNLIVEKEVFVRTFRLVVSMTVAGLLTMASLYGQGLTGQISGSVQDSSGSAMTGATVELTNTGTGLIKQGTTDASGAFIFPQLLAGTYTITVASPGFKKYEQKDIALSSSERSVLRTIVMELGSLSESVSVTAEAAQLQTQSSEHSASITTTQITETPQKGRIFLNLLSLMPGVINNSNFEGPGDTSGGVGGLVINGRGSGSLSVTTDGVPNHDTGCQCGPPAIPSLESIGEIKVLLSTYQAEYGRNSGGMITTVTKAGTAQFHGGVYYFKRNEALNANSFFGNRDNTPRPRYRYDDVGYYIGGPVLIPGVIKTRDKLFFFWSQEFLPRTIPLGPNRATFPTALERGGNFSQTLDTSGKQIPIQDPLNNKVQFPGNIIPSNRLDKAGVGLLSVFPMPNTVDPSNTFNTTLQGTQNEPHRFEVLRVDWNIGKKTTFYARGLYNSDTRSTTNWFNSFPVSNSFPLITGAYNYPTKGIVFTMIHTFNPTLINEVTIGVTRYLQNPFVPNPASLDRVNRAKLGINFPQFYPELNPLNVIPNATFGGVQTPPTINWEGRWIFFGTDTEKAFSDNLTKIYGKHNFKAGVYYENSARNASASGGSLMGTASFARDTNDPLDTNYAFSNAALGTLTSYTEANARMQEHARYYNLEWFAQDNWRMTKRLTLDLGVRFYHISTSKNAGTYLASFEQSQFNASTAAKLIQPYKATPTSARVGRNPATGEVVPAILIGTLAAGSGTFFQGMQPVWERIMTGPGLNIAPRIGFAWDVFGDGKTAVRGGFGIFPGRINDDATTSAFASQPPMLKNLTLNYTTISALLAAPASFSPATVRAVQHNHDSPTNYTISFGVQRDVGFHTVLDVSYVGALGRHLAMSRSLNAEPYGTNFLPSSIDPTTGNSPLPINFLRPIQGYGDITYYQLSTTSNYHSMQTTLRRRFQNSLTMGMAWTWSKAMEYTSGTANPFTDYESWNYGKTSTDRTHTVVVNYDYTIPSLSRIWKNQFAKAVGDGWGISGITSLLSGAPLGVTYSLVSTTDLTGGGGSGVDTRVDLKGPVALPKSDRTPLRAFNTSMIAPPADRFGRGNAPKDVFRGPGTNNFDITINKLFTFGHDGTKSIQFRFETYNSFNHTQFSAIDTAARFDAAGAQTNARFGQYTSTLSARKAQVGLKFAF